MYIDMKSSSLSLSLPILCICILFAVVLVVRCGYWHLHLEGMATMANTATANETRLNPVVDDLKKQVDLMQTTYDQLKNGVEDQTNRIHANAQMLLKVMGDTPNQTNNITHANVNTDDPSKTRIPNVVM